MFDLYQKTITINGNSYQIIPLGGEYLPKLYSVLGSMSGKEEKQIFKELTEEQVSTIFKLCYETIRSSYPQQDPAVIDRFVGQNLMEIFNAVVEVNLKDESRS